MCPVFSVCIITDYMWLHNTHTHMCICLILKWFLRHAVKVSIFQLFVLWPTLIQIITEHLITFIICLRFIRSIWARECIVALIPHHMQNQQYVTRGRSQVKCCLSSGASVCVGMHASISMAILYEDIDNCILWEYVCYYMSRSQLASHGRVLRGQYRSEGIVTYNKDAVNNKPWSEGSIICRISACGLRLRLNPTPSRVSSCRKDRLICVCARLCVWGPALLLMKSFKS